eukprot:1751737-Prymnesium_polylepis.2
MCFPFEAFSRELARELAQSHSFVCSSISSGDGGVPGRVCGGVGARDDDTSRYNETHCIRSGPTLTCYKQRTSLGGSERTK